MRLLRMVFVLFLLVGIVGSWAEVVWAAPPTLTYGAKGGYVYDLEHRLDQLGLYTGPQDGIFGPVLLDAVRKFQEREGLAVDGILGPKTWARLYDRTLNEREIALLMHLVSAEAGGEPFAGQVAVAAVVLNRLHDPRFPSTVEDVIFQPGAFSPVANGTIWNDPVPTARAAVYAALRGWDPTHGARYFYNPQMATNAWIRSRPVLTVIGGHVFAA